MRLDGFTSGPAVRGKESNRGSMVFDACVKRVGDEFDRTSEGLVGQRRGEREARECRVAKSHIRVVPAIDLRDGLADWHLVEHETP